MMNDVKYNANCTTKNPRLIAEDSKGNECIWNYTCSEQATRYFHYSKKTEKVKT